VALGLSLAVTRRPGVFRKPGLLLGGAGLAIATALLAYAYLPLRTWSGAFMWGDPGQASGFVDYVTGQMYADNRFAARDANYLAAVLDYLRYISEVTGVVPWLGLGLLMRSRLTEAPRFTAGLVLGVLSMCASSALQPLERANPDNVAYLGPAAALLIADGVAGLGALWSGRKRPLLAIGLALTALPPWRLSSLPERLASDLPAFETLTGLWVEGPEPRALVVVTQDATAGNWMMAQRLDGARPDVAVFMAGLAASSFHWRTLASHPAFDGKPRFGPGRSRHERLLGGLLASARERVPIYLEREAAGFERSAVSGAYLVNDQQGAPAVRVGGILAQHPYRAGLWQGHATEQAQECGFAAAAGTAQEHPLSAFDAQALDFDHRQRAFGPGEAHTGKFDDGIGVIRHSENLPDYAGNRAKPAIRDER